MCNYKEYKIIFKTEKKTLLSINGADYTAKFY